MVDGKRGGEKCPWDPNELRFLLEQPFFLPNLHLGHPEATLKEFTIYPAGALCREEDILPPWRNRTFWWKTLGPLLGTFDQQPKNRNYLDTLSY